MHTPRSPFTAVLWLAAAFIGLGALALPAQAQAVASPAAALERTLEQSLGRVLGAIDTDALTKGIEQAAADVAGGKPPAEVGDSPAVRDMQTRVQKEMAQITPQLLKGLLALMTPLLAEMKSELRDSLSDLKERGTPSPRLPGHVPDPALR